MNEDNAWKALLAHSSSTFNGEATPPYGFVTSLTAQLRTEQRMQADAERIGWRALMASFGVLAIAAVVTFSLKPAERGDFDPGVRSLVQMDNLPVS